VNGCRLKRPRHRKRESRSGIGPVEFGMPWRSATFKKVR
jgi:hypothetical protein